MSKASADKWDDTVRTGKEIGYRPEPEEGVLYGVFVRKFDSARLEMSPWVIETELTTSEPKARGIWDEVLAATKSGKFICGALIGVNKIWAPGELKINPDKYTARAIAVDVRASHLLRDGKQSGKDQVPDGSGLASAIDSEVDRFMRSHDQTGDDAAKDQAHNTANGTPDPNPDNLPVAPMEGDPTAVQGDGRIGTALSEDGQSLVPVDDGRRGNNRGKGKGKGKVTQ